VARDGGYILDAGAIMQDDTNPENLKFLTRFARDHGVYSGRSFSESVPQGSPLRPCDGADVSQLRGLREGSRVSIPAPGVCLPWEVKRTELPELSGDVDLLERIWKQVDAHGYTYIWQLLLSF